MPSYPIDTSGNSSPLSVADFGLGIAEQWLEGHARAGGGSGDTIPEIQDDVTAALEHCRHARETLRDLPIHQIHSERTKEA